MAGPEHLYDEAVTIWRRSGVTAGGDPTFGAAEAALGHWIEESVVITSADGSEIGSKSSVFLAELLALEDRAYHGTSVAADPDSIGALRVVSRNLSRRPGGGLEVRRYYLA